MIFIISHVLKSRINNIEIKIKIKMNPALDPLKIGKVVYLAFAVFEYLDNETNLSKRAH
jgi:hypothetical protein